MRRALILSLGVVLMAFPAVAQNTSIESLSGLQFNFGNPGARALGMGGAFLGLADDASAAEANPAGLTILRKAEFTVEARNYLEQQVLTTSGTFPDLQRTGFNNHSQRAQLAFASAVFPIRNRATVGVYFHHTLRNEGAGSVFPTEDEITGQITPLPNFFLPANGTPVTQQECIDIVRDTGDFFSCLEYTVNPFISAVNVDMKTYGIAGAIQLHPRFSIGATARYQTFDETALTFRFDPNTFAFQNITAQATGEIDESGAFVDKTETDITFAAGFKWSPTDKLSFGGVYKVGAEFDAPTLFASLETDFILADETRFHIPDVAGLGVSFRPIPSLTINVDAVHVTYSNLVDDFFSFSEAVREVPNAFEAKDVTEIHVGGEYYFPTRVPFALRAGYWRDPAHSTQYVGPLNHPDRVAEALLFPKGEDQDHFSIGAGLAWPRFQIDIAYDTSDRYKVGSITAVTRF